jgi:hypothetical protein
MHISAGGVTAALGLRIKSGCAMAALLGGPVDAPQLLDRRKVDLSDPADPELRQPYHAARGVGLAEGETLARRLQAIEDFSQRSLSRVFGDYESGGNTLCGAGLVIGSDVDPARIGNQHIRAHALEGRLFRRLVEAAMARRGLSCAAWVERALYGAAMQQLGRSEAQIKTVVTELGRRANGGWRSDDKAAAVAAWLVLSGCCP